MTASLVVTSNAPATAEPQPMRLIEEIVVEEFLPTFRSMLAAGLEERGLTQHEIADRLGLSQSAVSKHIHGEIDRTDQIASDERVQSVTTDLADGLASGDLTPTEALIETEHTVRELERGVCSPSCMPLRYRSSTRTCRFTGPPTSCVRRFGSANRSGVGYACSELPTGSRGRSRTSGQTLPSALPMPRRLKTSSRSRDGCSRSGDASWSRTSRRSA